MPRHPPPFVVVGRTIGVAAGDTRVSELIPLCHDLQHQRVCEEARRVPCAPRTSALAVATSAHSARARSGSCPKRRSRRRSRFRGRWLPRMRSRSSPLSPGTEWTSTIRSCADASPRRSSSSARTASKCSGCGVGCVRGPRGWSSVQVRADVADLLEDSRLMPSGIADPRAGISASGVVEGYVSPAAVDDLIRDYLLVESERPNVWLHVADIPSDASGRVPLGFVIADLLDHGGPRERSQAANLLAASRDDGPADHDRAARPRRRGGRLLARAARSLRRDSRGLVSHRADSWSSSTASNAAPCRRAPQTTATRSSISGHGRACSATSPVRWYGAGSGRAGSRPMATSTDGSAVTR